MILRGNDLLAVLKTKQPMRTKQLLRPVPNWSTLIRLGSVDSSSAMLRAVLTSKAFSLKPFLFTNCRICLTLLRSLYAFVTLCDHRDNSNMDRMRWKALELTYLS